MSIDPRLEFLKQFGIQVDDKELCSICNMPIMASGSPLPPPCSVCSNSKYCVGCSASTAVEGKSKAYCIKQFPGFAF